MSDFVLNVPEGFIPLVLTPEHVDALANEELTDEVIDAARFAWGLHRRAEQDR